MPGAAKRRLKQGVTLARKLIAAQRELKRVTDEAISCQAKVARLESELSRANELLDSVRKQPHAVLVAELRETERALRTARDELAVRTAVVEGLERKNLELHRVHNAMSADLEKLLDSEREIDELRVVVGDLRATAAPAHDAPAKSTHSGKQTRKQRAVVSIARPERRKTGSEWR